MRLFSFARDDGHRVTRFGSSFVLTPLADPHGQARVACFHVGPGESIGEHEAVVGQLFLVLDGSGWVSGDDGVRVALAAQQGAYWTVGERHAAGTERGMTAIVVEGDELDVTAREMSR